jgi:hypothetical protein
MLTKYGTQALVKFSFIDFGPNGQSKLPLYTNTDIYSCKKFWKEQTAYLPLLSLLLFFQNLGWIHWHTDSKVISLACAYFFPKLGKVLPRFMCDYRRGFGLVNIFNERLWHVNILTAPHTKHVKTAAEFCVLLGKRHARPRVRTDARTPSYSLNLSTCAYVSLAPVISAPRITASGCDCITHGRKCIDFRDGHVDTCKYMMTLQTRTQC